jgi:hypothetical protein
MQRHRQYPAAAPFRMLPQRAAVEGLLYPIFRRPTFLKLVRVPAPRSDVL